MTYSQPARATNGRILGVLVAGFVVVSTAFAAAQGYALLATSSPTLTPPSSPVASSQSSMSALPSTIASPGDARPSRHGGALGEADGVLPDGVTVFDGEYPGVANLDPDLLHALRQAATHAAKDGIELSVNSGWRSPEYQERLLRDAISKYGSRAKAARWVGTPTTSAHVSGDAVDLGPLKATAWLSRHGARYGLCQIYRNEPWHYELRPRAIDHRCPRMYPDPTHDPRMQQ